MIDVYCYLRCSICKKALKWLDKKGVKYRLFDLKEENPKVFERLTRRLGAAIGQGAVSALRSVALR